MELKETIKNQIADIMLEKENRSKISLERKILELYKELDNLASLMLNPNENFSKLQEIWNNIPKFRIMSGALN